MLGIAIGENEKMIIIEKKVKESIIKHRPFIN